MDFKQFTTTLVSGCLLFSFTSLLSQNESIYTNAFEYYSKQEFQEALRLFEECISQDSLNTFCMEKAGLSAYQLGDIPKAKALFFNLEKLDSTNRIAIAQLSTIYDQEKNIPKAIKYYTKLKKLIPQNPVYHRKLAQQYHNAGLHVEAFPHYLEALKLNPRDVFTINGIAEIFLSNKQYIEADSMLREGLKLDSLNINFNLLMAQSQYRQKAYDSTVHYLERIRYEIDLSPYYNKLFGYSYIQIDSFERSIPLLEKSLVDEGSKEYAHYYLATAYEKLENPEYALFHYQKALEEGISGNIDLYHRGLAKLYNEKKQLGDAIDHYIDAYKYGKDPVVLFYLARASDIYYKDKNIAVNYYKKYIKSNDSNADYKKYAKERKLHLQEQLHLGM